MDDEAPGENIEQATDRIPSEGIVTRYHQTDSGIPLLARYGPDQWSGTRDPAGTFPYTRGNYSQMYRDQLWHRDLYAGFGNAEQARDRYRELLRGGASGVNMAFDLPTQLGYDSDSLEAAAEVGKVGLAVDSLADLEDLFEAIPLSEAGIVFTVGNGIGPVAAAWFELLGRAQGVEPSEYVVHLQNDPLKEFTGRGAFIFPVEPHVRLACDVVEYAVRQGYSHWKPIGICGSQYRWGGGSAFHEIGFALAAARTYIEELLARGLNIDDFAPLLEMHLTVDTDVLEEVAKFRAARTLWARMLRDEYGALRPESQQLRISLYTAGYRLTAQEPLNNAVRVTLQALGAVLGGVEHLGTLSIDEALSTPSPETARLAVQTQNILGYETSVPSVPDPLGGSWFVEWLTDEMIVRIREMERKVLDFGGTTKALKEGLLQGIIQDSAYEYEQAIEERRRTVVGVNRFVSSDRQSTLKAFRVSKAARERQVSRLRALRERRDNQAVAAALDGLEDVGRGGENIMTPMLNACGVYATIGEVHERLRRVFGSWESEHVTL